MRAFFPTKFGSAHGCAVRTDALKRGLFSKIKNVSERHSFGYFYLAVERKVTRRQGRNSNNKGYRKAHKRRPATAQYGINIPRLTRILH